MSGIEGKSVVITGASRGIGAEAARVFAAAGARLTLLARDASAVEALAGEIAEAGGTAQAQGGDVADPRAVAAAVDAARRAFGGLDILINNAAVIAPIATLEAADPAEWARAIDVNLKGVYHGMRAAIPVMTTAGGGTILTVSSGAAHNPLEGWSAYCASKAGAAMLTMCADREGREQGIRAIGLSPGTVATDMQRQIKASGVNAVSRLDWSEHIPPDWPARALLWMCGPGADPWLGQEISLRDPEIRRQVGLVR